MAGASASGDGGPPAAPGERPWRAGSKTFRTFLRRLPAAAPVAILAGAHPDGLTAGLLLRRALRQDGRPVRLLFPAKGEDARGAAARARLAEVRPGAVIVAGVGGLTAPPLPDVATLAIDRRPLSELAPTITAISSAGWELPVSTSVLAYWLAQAVADLRQLDWVAAVGAMAAFGERVASPVVIGAKSAYGGNWLHEMVVLLTAAARAATPEPETAVRLLGQARHPKDFVLGERPERARLQAARAEVEAAIEQAKRVEPLRREPVTLVSVNSPCAVQGVLAHIWSRRAAGPALVANTGYLPGRVAFALAEPAGGEWPARLAAALPGDTVLEADVEGEVALAGHVAAGTWPAVLDSLN